MAGIVHKVASWVHAFDEAVEVLNPIWNAAIVLGLGSLAWLAFDREPPFEVLRVYPAQAMPGEQVQIVAKVRRDLDRNCASDMSRYVFDSRGMRWDEPTRHFSAETIEVLAGSQPDMLRLSVMVPFDAHPGPGKVVSDLEYRCNITHAAWPIRVTAVMPFTVLPRQ